MTRAGIVPAIMATLAAAFPSLHVILDDFSEAKTKDIEESLRDHGGVIVVKPLSGTDKLDQASSRPAEIAAASVVIRTNAAVTGAPEAYATTDAIISAVLADRSIRAELAQNATTLIESDRPRLSYEINFTVKITP